MADHDEILRRQRERMQEHRQWLQQQKDALQGMGTGAPAPVPADREAASPASEGRYYHHADPHAAEYDSPQQQQSQQGHYAAAASGQRFGSAMYEESGMDTQRSYARSIGSPLNVYARSTQWARRREQKLEELKSLQASVNETHCPFAPETHDIKYSSPASRRRAAKVRGMESFMQRQERARELREDKILKIKCDGSKWTNSVTVPEEFELGNRRARPIPSLSQPLKAPSTSTPQQLHELLHDRTAVGDARDHMAASVVPRGAFSSKASTAIIDVAATRSVSGMP
eukprot:CAMPEP_0174855458 /NCGR_PEP_ID=MMETSP1114-20130205/33328_1 /TAXON_ID=312471 /ORGANISM="Neobodo designis, Strain CCAP 1951/1" /LENGTH=284 /DNA_ID=CAMNT_0016090199 /DNA_START=36 /DNA_END=890 /DNA_ORIENTATION=+